LAQAGDPCAQFELGMKYRWVGNDNEAAKWFHFSAGQGHTDAQFFIGLHYRLQANDMVEAFRWFRVAARKGDMKSKSFMNKIYDKVVDGIFHGNEKKYDQLLASAEQGDAIAQFELGEWLVFSHVRMSKEWILKSAEQGYVRAQETAD
jgi:hypothetical protein